MSHKVTGSCVWISLLKNLKIKHNKAGKLLNFLKNNNILTIDITCNGLILTDKELKENFEAISNITHVDYYDCSAQDPLLLLICKVYNVSIIHNYNGTIIKYININYPKKLIKLVSNNEHMF